MTCTSSRTAYRAATRRRSRWRSRGCAKLVHRSRLVRACCSSCKVRALRPIVGMGDIKCERCLVDASSPNFKAFANVIKAEKETTTQTMQTLLPVRHSVL